MITPAAIGPQYFRETAAVFNEAAGGPPDRAKLAEIMRRHGLTPAPPPRKHRVSIRFCKPERKKAARFRWLPLGVYQLKVRKT